ncbi:hypothetical protein TrRE_jg9564, partial [Triparma retinervis]
MLLLLSLCLILTNTSSLSNVGPTFNAPSPPPSSLSNVGPTFNAPTPPSFPRGIGEGGFRVDDWVSAWQTFKPGNVDRLKLKLRSGAIPKDLRGSLWKNGPGKFHQRIDGRVRHVLDGDGLIFRITLDENGDSYFTSRFVETPCFLKEEKTGKVEMRSTFGTARVLGDDAVGEDVIRERRIVDALRNVGDVNIKNPAN